MDTITNNEFATKRFGKSGLNREMFLDCFVEPIDMSELTDEQMQKFADYVEEHIRILYPETADKMFDLWSKVMENDDTADEQSDEIAIECIDVWRAYWIACGRFAVIAGGKVIEKNEKEDGE